MRPSSRRGCRANGAGRSLRDLGWRRHCELESALIEHEAVAEVALIPSPNPLRLAVPKAYLILVAGLQPSRELAESVFAFSRKQLAPYKRVCRIEFVAELPNTLSGKIRRVQLRAQEVAQRSGGARAAGAYFEEDFAST